MRLREFAPGGGGDSGDYLRALASAWYNGVFDTGSLPKGIKTQEDVERLLNRGIVCPDGKTRKLHIDYNSDFDGVEIYSDDYYEHGDLDGNDGRTGQPWGPWDHMEFAGDELDEGVAEGYSLGKVLSLPELLDQIKHILAAKHPGIGWRMTMPAENTFLFSAQNDYDVWSMLVVEPGGDDWVAVGHGMVDPDGKPIIFDRQQLPMTLASASEIADEAIQTYHDIDLSDYADDDYNQGMAEGSLNEFAPAGGGGNIPRGPKTPRRGPWGDNGEDPYQLRRYNRSVDFFDQFDSDGVDKQNFDKATGEYEGYYFDRDAASGITQIAYFKFDDPTKIGDNDPGIGWYYEPIDEGVAEGLNEFAPDSNDGGEDDVLHRYARMWWAGDEATQMQIERALARMGWEIGEDEGSYDNGGVFVVRAGDINGRSYQSWPAEELDEGSDPWGSPGRYVGDTGPAQLTTTVAKVQLKPGDQVLYKPTEQRARIEALSRDGTQARIHIATPMGGRTFNCKTADLKALGRGLADEGATVTTTPGSIEPGGAVDNFKQQMANRTEIDYLKNLAGIKEGRDLCNVCGQTPCNCTH